MKFLKRLLVSPVFFILAFICCSLSVVGWVLGDENMFDRYVPLLDFLEEWVDK